MTSQSSQISQTMTRLQVTFASDAVHTLAQSFLATEDVRSSWVVLKAMSLAQQSSGVVTFALLQQAMDEVLQPVSR